MNNTVILSTQILQQTEIVNQIPVFRGTGIPVSLIFEYFRNGNGCSQFIVDHPSVNSDIAKLLSEYAVQIILNKIRIEFDVKETEFLIMNNLDPFLKDAAYFIIEKQHASVAIIQRKFLTGHYRSNQIINDLVKIGVVGGQVSENQFQILLKDKRGIDCLFANLKSNHHQLQEKTLTT
ncbi:MAG: DUF433 domain-containing protein [Bacteroidetes bacterium]|nr:DUF433 domain-containing protein [Bacteroidota bacterium]